MFVCSSVHVCVCVCGRVNPPGRALAEDVGGNQRSQLNNGIYTENPKNGKREERE